MPVTNRVGLATGDYLKAQPPSWETVETGLAVFALLVIIRYCAQQSYLWLRPSESHSPPPPPQYSPLSYHDLSLPRYQQTRPWAMDEKLSSSAPKPGLNSINGINGTHGIAGHPQQRESHHDNGPTVIPIDDMSRHFISRLPPVPPLTPPELSHSVFTLDGRERDHDSLIHQPNPDYMSSTAVDPAGSLIPRRRSYTKTLPMGSPPHPHYPHHQQQYPHQQEQQWKQSSSEAADPSFSSASLPGPSPTSAEAEAEVETQRNVDVQGEIISVLDRDGAGWSRHTRVYGGGTCLACAASEGGGFYGATVTPEEMR